MSTSLDLITDALFEINAVAPGEPISPDDSALALRHLNRMIASDSINRGKIYTIGITQWPTEAQKQSYTIGQDPTGALTPDWNGPRPVKITHANLLLETSPALRRPIKILDDGQWADIRLQAIYTYPERLYNDGDNPLSTIYFEPIPDSAYQIELYTWQAIAQIADLTTPIIIPPGYEDYWLYTLALRLCAPFGRQASQGTQAQALKASQAINLINTVPPRLRNDSAPRRGAGRYNYLSGLVE